MIYNWLRVSGNKSAHLSHVQIVRIAIFDVLALHPASRSLLCMPMFTYIHIYVDTHLQKHTHVYIHICQCPNLRSQKRTSLTPWALVDQLHQYSLMGALLCDLQYSLQLSHILSLGGRVVGVKDSTTDVFLHGGLSHIYPHLLFFETHSPEMSCVVITAPGLICLSGYRT